MLLTRCQCATMQEWTALSTVVPLLSVYKLVQASLSKASSTTAPVHTSLLGGTVILCGEAVAVAVSDTP